MASRVTWRSLVAMALGDTAGSYAAIEWAEPLSQRLAALLRANGFAVHNVGDGMCIRIEAEPVGRLMTAAEMDAVGIQEGTP